MAVGDKIAVIESCGSVRRMKGDRQRLLSVPSREHRGLKGLVGIGLISTCLHPWVYPAPAIGAMSSNLLLETGSTDGVQVGVDHADSMVPPFRAASRDRTQGFVAGQWRPTHADRLDGSWSWVHDRLPSGETVTGPGDFHLGTHAVVWDKPVALGLGWHVKLPNARDDTELGSDETDVVVQATASKSWQSLSVMSGAGVVILGDPVRFANQDDAALLWGGLAGSSHGIHWFSKVGGTLQSARNPARFTIELGANHGCPVGLGGSLRTGLTSAAPSWGGRIWLGFGFGCD